MTSISALTNAVVLTLSAATTGSAADTACGSQASNDEAFFECLGEEMDRQKGRLYSHHDKMKRQLTAADFKRFHDSELKWMESVQQSCGPDTWIGKSAAANIPIVRCLIDSTAQHVAKLEASRQSK